VRASLVRLAVHVSALRARIEAEGVRRTFFVCSTPRTGSTMLCELLAGTGLVGRADEYFGEDFRQEVVPGLSRRAFDDYLVGLAEHARGTGTLGIKLHWDQVEVFLYLLRLRRGLRGAGDREVLEAVFPAPRFVWMRRGDTLAQAVSWWKAMTTGKWVDGKPVTGAPEFDVDGIATRIRRIEEHDGAWRRWFGANGVEELADDPTAAVRAVLEHVGVAPPPGLAVEHVTERQADAVNQDWVRRYREATEPGRPARR
jgi:LPS sulfotransferase NodH